MKIIIIYNKVKTKYADYHIGAFGLHFIFLIPRSPTLLLTQDEVELTSNKGRILITDKQDF